MDEHERYALYAEQGKQLRAKLGDRLTTDVRDLGQGPQFVYVVDDEAFTRETALLKFLEPEPEPTPSTLTVTVVRTGEAAVAKLAGEFGKSLEAPALPPTVPTRTAGLPKPPITVADYQAAKPKKAEPKKTELKAPEGTKSGFLQHTDDGRMTLF